MSLIQPVILCGGSGTRLWPLSRPERPKPFLPLLGKRTLFQQALDRVADGTRFAEPMVVAGPAHVALIEAQAGPHRLIVEPVARNTAPAIALAAALAEPDTVLLVCPSDQHIADTDAFLSAVDDGARLAHDGYLVSLGIAPTHPATGYGYIERGEPLAAGHRTQRFVEKPDADRARAFLDAGGFVWNGGIFVFRAGDYLAELAAHDPETAAAVRRAVTEGAWSGDRFDPAAEAFEAVSGQSIDYAVMEHTARAAVVSADMGWSDIGDWSALADARSQAGAGAAGDHLDCRDITIETDGPRVSVVGLEGVIVVVSGNEVLVTSRAGAQQVGKLPGASGKGRTP